MTALTALTRTDRQRLLKRLAELREMDVLMRERGTLAGPDEPVPLHRAGCGTTESASQGWPR